MGKIAQSSPGLGEIFARMELTQETLQQMSQWQLWTIAFHMVAAHEGLDCVEINSEETKQEDKKEAMLMKTRFPSDWLAANRVTAKLIYVHAKDTTRWFEFSFQEKQGNKIEVKLIKAKKNPSVMDPVPGSVSKFIPMGDGAFNHTSFANFTAAPWQPECEQIATFRTFLNQEILRQQAAGSSGVFQNPSSQFFQSGNSNLMSSQPPNRGAPPMHRSPDQIPTSSLIGGGNHQPNPYFSTGNPLQAGRPNIIGDPTLSGPHQPGFYGGGGPAGFSGNLVGPNSQIFQGGGQFGQPMMGGGAQGGLGPFPPHGGMMGGPLGPGGVMYPPEGTNDLHPDLPGDPMNPMNMNPLGGGQGRLGPGGFPMGGGRGTGSNNPFRPGGNMFM